MNNKFFLDSNIFVCSFDAGARRSGIALGTTFFLVIRSLAMSHSTLLFRIILTTILLLLVGRAANSQTSTACQDGALPTASLTVVATGTPPPKVGLNVSLSTVDSGRPGKRISSQDTKSGEQVEFSSLCPGEYIVQINGAYMQVPSTVEVDCGYIARKKIKLRAKEARKLALLVRWKKGTVCL